MKTISVDHASAGKPFSLITSFQVSSSFFSTPERSICRPSYLSLSQKTNARHKIKKTMQVMFRFFLNYSFWQLKGDACRLIFFELRASVCVTLPSLYLSRQCSQQLKEAEHSKQAGSHCSFLFRLSVWVHIIQLRVLVCEFFLNVRHGMEW